MKIRLIRGGGFFRPPFFSEETDTDIVVICLQGDCEYALPPVYDSSPLPPCHSVFFSEPRFTLDCGDDSIVILSTIDNSLHPAPPTQSPILLDELSVNVLFDVFVANHRSEKHQRSALDFICHQIIPAAAKDEYDKQAPAPLSAAVEDYLSRCLDEPLSLADLAEEFDCSSAFLTRQLRQAGKPSPLRLLGELRLREARKLLQQNDLSVTHIAARVGYSDLAAFSHFFKKHTGMSPTEYRRNLNWLV